MKHISRYNFFKKYFHTRTMFQGGQVGIVPLDVELTRSLNTRTSREKIHEISVTGKYILLSYFLLYYKIQHFRTRTKNINQQCVYYTLLTQACSSHLSEGAASSATAINLTCAIYLRRRCLVRIY